MSAAGKLNEAELLYTQALEHFIRIENINVGAIKVKYRLTITCREQGKFDEAESHCKELIEWGTTLNGDQHIDVLSSRDILLTIYTEIGRYNDAEQLYLSMLEENVRGSVVELLVTTHMVDLRRSQGRHKEARDFCIKLNQLNRGFYGEFHPSTIVGVGKLLSGDLDRGLNDQLEQDLLQNIAEKKRTFGANHPTTIQTLTDLACAYAETGRFEDSLQLLQEVDESGGSEIMESPVRYAATLGKRASAYYAMKRYADAEKLERKVLDVRRKIFPDTHRMVLTTMTNLASTVNAMGQHREAQAIMRQVVAVYQDLAESNMSAIPDLLKAKVSLAGALFLGNELLEALRLYEEVVEIGDRLVMNKSLVDEWKAQREVARRVMRMVRLRRMD